MVTRLDELETTSDDYLEMFICGATNFCEFYTAEGLVEEGEPKCQRIMITP